VVEIFWDPGDQGQTFVGGGEVLSGHFSVVLDVDPTTLGKPNLNATVTDPNGNTSEFSGQSQQILWLPHLVFTAMSPSGHRQIYLSADGAPPVSLTENWNPGSDDFNPALAGGVSCDKLLFVSLHTGNEEVFVMDAVTNAQPQQVTTNPAGDYDPAWLVPCQRLVFVSQRDGNPQIYAVNLDGSHLQRLTTNAAADISPSAFLNGKQIVFISNRSGSNALWIMNADGSNQSPLGGVTGTSSQPAISPDGLTVAMAVTQNNTSEIAVVGVNGSGFAQLTHDGAHASHPTWLADGQNLIFSSDRSGTTNLYSINASGAGLQALPLSPDTGSEPSAGGQ
jgi:TolB protein